MTDTLKAIAELATELEAARPSDLKSGKQIAATATIDFAIEKSAIVASVGATPESGGRTVRFTPGSERRRWSCTCSADESPWCKHVVATVLAAEAADRPLGTP